MVGSRDRHGDALNPPTSEDFVALLPTSGLRRQGMSTIEFCVGPRTDGGPVNPNRRPGRTSPVFVRLFSEDPPQAEHNPLRVK